MADHYRFALVGPSFFSYLPAIRERFEKRGIASAVFDERHANTIPVKILYRVGFYRLFQARKRLHLNQIVEQVLAGGYTDVLLVAVEVCDRPFVQRLVDAGIRVHLYMWDSARNKPAYLAYLDLLQGRASFDPDDCKAYGLTYIPLFAEDVFSARVQGQAVDFPRMIDVSFCGTLHSDRARHVAALARFAKMHGLQARFMLYFHSRWLLALKGLVNPSNFLFLWTISTKGYAKKDIFHLLASSRYVFDVQHAGQMGLTARTFEVLRAGARLVTLNARALELLPPTLLERVRHVKDVEGLSEIDFRSHEPDVPLTAEQDYYLSLDRFVDDLLVSAGLSVPLPGGGVESD